MANSDWISPDWANPDWVRGDALGLLIPAHAEALRAGGTAFLTEAFRAFGALEADNSVTAINRFEASAGGSTGRKLILSVAYEKPAADLPTELFVKFSRDFDDPVRDRARTQMELEVKFASLSRVPEFPIAVPVNLFADYHAESGTGILVSQRIAYGRDGVEPHYDKCLDYELPRPLEHYQALITALARLAGTHKAGRLPAWLTEQFPFDMAKLSVGERVPYTAKQLQNRVARLSDFAARHPKLLPANITSQAFLARLSEEIARFPEHEAAINAYLDSDPDFIALCHWNANIDNGWFWRHADGRLECGLLDWGCVSQMNVAMALWGSMSGAETELWDRHLDDLLGLYVREFQACGGPALDVAKLKTKLMLYIAMMGLAWLMDAPPVLKALIPDLDEVEDRFDPRIARNEPARTQLQMMTNFLNLWQTQDFGAILQGFLAETGRLTP